VYNIITMKIESNVKSLEMAASKAISKEKLIENESSLNGVRRRLTEDGRHFRAINIWDSAARRRLDGAVHRTCQRTLALASPATSFRQKDDRLTSNDKQAKVGMGSGGHGRTAWRGSSMGAVSASAARWRGAGRTGGGAHCGALCTSIEMYQWRI